MASVHQKQPEPRVMVSVWVISIFLDFFCLVGCAQADKHIKDNDSKKALFISFISKGLSFLLIGIMVFIQF